MKIVALAAAAIVAGFNAADAASISFVNFATYSSFISAPGSKAVETFEGFTEGQILGTLPTAVGGFTTLGGDGGGSSVIGDGTNLAVRDNPNFGRVNTTPGGSKFLDSNDTLGMHWNVGVSGKRVGSLAFTLTDASDQGAKLELSVNGQLFQTITPLRPNGELRYVLVDFGGFVTDATIKLTNSKIDDGFGVDDVTANVAPIPLPAAAPLMVGGLAALGLLGRRKRRAA